MNKMLKSRHCVNIYVNVCMYACTHYVSMHACLHAITLHGRFFTVAYAILRSECLWNALWKQGWVELQHLGRQWYFVFIRLGRWGKWMGASNAFFLAAFPTSPQGELQSLQNRVLVSVGSTHSQSPGTVLLAAEERWDQKEEERRHVRLETNREMSPNKFPQSLREWAARASALGKGEWLRASLRTQPWLCEIPPAFWLSPQAMRWDVRQWKWSCDVPGLLYGGWKQQRVASLLEQTRHFGCWPNIKEFSCLLFSWHCPVYYNIAEKPITFCFLSALTVGRGPIHTSRKETDMTERQKGERETYSNRDTQRQRVWADGLMNREILFISITGKANSNKQERKRSRSYVLFHMRSFGEFLWGDNVWTDIWMDCLWKRKRKQSLSLKGL